MQREPLLPHYQVLRLREAVISARMTDARTALLAGIHPHIAAGLPLASSPGTQVLNDLDALNMTGSISDGSVPLVRWLQNAAALAGPKVEAETFRSAFERVQAATTRTGDAATRAARLAAASASPLRIDAVATTPAGSAIDIANVGMRGSSENPSTRASSTTNEWDDRAKRSSSRPGPGPIDIVVMIALRQEFEDFVSTVGCPLDPLEDTEFGGYDYRFGFAGYSCIARVMGDMGPERAGRFADRLLSRWAPRVVANLGIAASLHDDLRLCDVVVADQVDAWAANLKAVRKSTREWEFRHRGKVYVTDHALAQEITNFPTAHKNEFSEWQDDCRRDLLASLPARSGSVLRRKGLLGVSPALHTSHLASGPVVGAARAFGNWLRSKDDTIHALEMEAGGIVAAATERRRPVPTLVIRGITDLGDERKQALDSVGDGALRHVAMRNASRLFVRLLVSQRLPRSEMSAQSSGFILRVVGKDVARAAPLWLGVPLDVGRDERNGLVLPVEDRSVSRIRHVRVVATADGVHVHVFSKNGIRTAGRCVGAGVVVRLEPGQAFSCGSTDICLLPESTLPSTTTEQPV